MNKRTFAAMLVFLSYLCTPCLQSISEQHVKGYSLMLGLIASVEIPLLFALDQKIDKRSSFSESITRQDVWLKSLVGGAIIAGLTYYISQKYTPANKFAWALNIKNKAQQNNLITCKYAEIKNNIIKAFEKKYFFSSVNKHPFSDAVRHLHQEYLLLCKAYKCILEAAEELRDDLEFKLKCDTLLKEIKELEEIVRLHAINILHTKQWFKEIAGVDPEKFKEIKHRFMKLPLHCRKAIDWCIDLFPFGIIKIPLPHPFTAQYTITDTFLDSLADWEQTK